VHIFQTIPCYTMCTCLGTNYVYNHVRVFDTTTGRNSGDDTTENSHQLSDINRQETAGHQHDYYNVDNSSTINTDPQYQELNTDTQRPVVYQQLAPR